MLISGCGIGHNKTLFFTKTNVGLDFDSQPPTAEVTIARREGVIAPTFEGGQTPPILTSFHLESKGFAALFAGISSTFVGGDSAVAFAKLYDDDYTSTLQTRQERNEFDSTLELSKLPYDSPSPGQSDPHKDKRLYLPGEVEPFLFGTDTSFGLKVAWSGMTAQVPDTVRLGFNRKEFALAPVTAVLKENAPNRYKVKIPSFLATIENSTKLGSVDDGGVRHLQYFATGKAADKLSLRYAVRKAMATRLDPEAAREFGKGQDKVLAFAVARLTYEGLKVAADNGDSLARTHVEKLNSLAQFVPDTYAFEHYGWDTTADKFTLVTVGANEESVGNGSLTGFRRVTTYRDGLAEKKGVVIQARATPDLVLDEREATGPDLANLAVKEQEIGELLSAFEHKVSSSGFMVAAIDYYVSLLSQ
jgi:hypothetical protein